MVLLISQCNTTVRVFTDSEQAIQQISKIHDIEQYNKWIRSDNRIILKKVTSLLKQKGINLELQKVKGHAEDQRNIKADQLAKEGRRSSIQLDLKVAKNDNIDYEVLWRSNKIENSVKLFITNLSKRYNDAEWAYSRKNNLAKDNEYN